jgi:phytanoyl-CoA hydroxylase
MDLQQAKEEFATQGYVAWRGFMDPREIGQVNAELDRYIRDIFPTLPDTAGFFEDKDDPATLMRLQNMCHYDDYFRQLYYGDRLMDIGRALLDDELVGKNLQWFNKLPNGGKATPPHQDGFYFMLEPNEGLTLWLAQDDVDEENGCVRYLPGSHKEDMRPHQRTDVLGFSQGITDYGAADYQREAPVCAQPGDLLIHHSMCVHRADANPSPRPRRALGFVYFAARAKEDAEKAAAYRQQLYTEWEKEGKI